MRNKIKKIMIILIFFNIIFLFNFSKASEKKEGIENFPQNYRPYLYELKNKYPNWNFTALYTGLDWNYVIGEENIFGKNLVPKSYSDRWKNTNPGEYNVEVDAGWVDCSKQALEYTMDPRNFLNEVRIFQFETLSFEEITSTKPTIEKVLYGTEFYNRKVDYYNSSGTLISTNSLYSDLILNAGKTSRVSSLHLAARIKQEVGPFLSHSSISGLVDGFKGLYNFYNIGATSSSEPMGAIKNGLQYAKDGKGMSSTNKAKYLIPWDTKEKAITGGGIFIGESYINVGQNTIYLQKFDVNDERQGTLFTHQYMTNVLAPYSEGKLTYNGYKNGDILNSNLSFLIPVYENMPELPTESPNINPSDYEQDNTKMYANVQTVLNIRSGPGTSYDIVATVTKDEIMTRIAKGKQSGELWDRVILSNGIVGYAFQSYLQEAPTESEKPIEEIQVSISKNPILKNERVPLEVKIIPEDATDTTLKYMSSDTTVAMVSDEGTILGLSSGKATITVYSEKYSVKTQIEVEIYSEVKDLILDMDSLIVQKGQTVKINATVLPEDANNKKIIYESQNPDIVQVDEDGNILGKEVGETKLAIETQENKIQKTVNIQVVELKNEIIFNDLVVSGNIISGLEDLNHKVIDIKNKIETTYRVEIYNSKDEVLPDNQLVGTGCKIKFFDESDNLAIEYNILYYGDVNGDGKINSIDLLVLQRHILEINLLNRCISQSW